VLKARGLCMWAFRLSEVRSVRGQRAGRHKRQRQASRRRARHAAGRGCGVPGQSGLRKVFAVTMVSSGLGLQARWASVTGGAMVRAREGATIA
jgi:hypothetical protein